jgi:hypothetical protein
MSKKQQAEVEARLKEFWDDHKDFDSGWARGILEELDEVILPHVFEPSAVEAGLEQLYVKSGVRVPRELLEQLYVKNGVSVQHLEQLYVKSGVRVPRELLEQEVKTTVVFPRELDLEKLDLEYDFVGDEPFDHLPAAALSALPIFKYDLALRAYADYGLLLLGEDIFTFILDRFPPHWLQNPHGGL